MDVKESVSKILESELNANLIIDLIEQTELPDTIVVNESVRGLCEIFRNWLEQDYKRCMPIVDGGAMPDDPVAERFNEWTRDKYGIVKNRLMELLADKQLQGIALSSLMSLIKWEGLGYQATHPAGPHHFPISTLTQMTHRILMGGEKQVLSDLMEYTCYEDVKYYLLQSIHAVLCSQQKNKESGTGNDEFSETVHKMLSLVSMATNKSPPTDNFLCGSPKGNGDKEHNVCSLQKHRKAFSDCWLAFLRFPLSQSLHEEVLVSLHSNVMPHMVKPRLLVDFLIGSYQQGGVKSILALNGLFILMHQYHLDYPNFYHNLYSLLEPGVMQVCYMPRLFRLLNIFLSSTHLPLYLVASFAKRIARLCLSAPPQGVAVGCVTVINLVRRHPNCRVLLHRSDPAVLQVTSDPYNMEEEDPAESGALDSCLWELQTLQNHYHPEVSTLVTRLLDPESGSRVMNIGEYLDWTDDMLLKSEYQEDFDKIPMNFIEPENIWGDICIA